MKLDVSSFRQEEDSLDCGLVGLAMVYDYFGVDRGLGDIQEDLHITEGVGTYVPQLGIDLLNNGFDVEIVTLNPFLFTKNDVGLGFDGVLNRFVSLKVDGGADLKVLDFFIRFMKLGGKVTVRLPNLKDLKDELGAGRPVSAVLTTNFLYHDKPDFNFHYNLVTGVDDDFIYVNDPMWDERGGKNKYTIEDFFYALYANAFGDVDNASLLKARKKG